MSFRLDGQCSECGWVLDTGYNCLNPNCPGKLIKNEFDGLPQHPRYATYEELTDALKKIADLERRVSNLEDGIFPEA